MHTENRKAWKGAGMEGPIARWYNRTRSKDMEDFRHEAKRVAGSLANGARVLEVAPGPGFFSIELARLGNLKPGGFWITGLDVSRTFVQIASENARNAGVTVDFQHGNASAMPFANESFDFIYCSAAFKNFTEPVKALDEMHRVLRPGGQASIVDLRQDASLDDVNAYIKKSGRGGFDAWITRWTFRHMLIKRAYSQDAFAQMAAESRFRSCRIATEAIGIEVRLAKTLEPAAQAV
jgi:ubiquinone/menaquinone biosynthesis C-methylase UbiE